MIHWGPYSVPGWAERSGDIQGLWAEKGAAYQFKHTPYAEWYENTIRIDGSGAQQHHIATYGRDFRYEKFGAQFTAASALENSTRNPSPVDLTSRPWCLGNRGHNNCR